MLAEDAEAVRQQLYVGPAGGEPDLETASRMRHALVDRGVGHVVELAEAVRAQMKDARTHS